jgi:hypothetical protein
MDEFAELCMLRMYIHSSILSFKKLQKVLNVISAPSLFLLYLKIYMNIALLCKLLVRFAVFIPCKETLYL